MNSFPDTNLLCLLLNQVSEWFLGLLAPLWTVLYQKANVWDALWYPLYSFKDVKNTYGGVLL